MIGDLFHDMPHSMSPRKQWIERLGLKERAATDAEREYAKTRYDIDDCKFVVHDANGVIGFGRTAIEASEHYCEVSGTRPWNAPQMDLGEN